MKFTQLPIGESFEYQNGRYSKVSPLIAVNLENNQQRMIPRSALVTPLSTTATKTVSPEPDKPLDAGKVVAAFEQYHAECLQWLQQEDRNIDDLRQRLEQARQLFLSQCGIS